MKIQSSSSSLDSLLPILPENQSGKNSRASERANESTQAAVPDEREKQKRLDAEKAAQDFETMFVDMMVKSMRETARPEDASNAEDVYQGMLDSEYSKAMTAANDFGIRQSIMQWMEQADPSIKNNNNSVEGKSKNSQDVDTIKLQNDMWALKAASQAYQLSAKQSQ